MTQDSAPTRSDTGPLPRPPGASMPTAGAQGGAALTPWLAIGLVLLWVVFAASINRSQFGDHFEQFTWAHSLEWGYHKHPPMPTWLLGLAIRLFGPSVWWTYVLSALFNAGTAGLTFLIARKLLGSPVAALAILFWGLHQGFSSRAQLWNHNTAMIFFIAATVWLVMRAVESGRPRRWWLAAGVVAGMALLSKYQAVVPLFGIIVALWHGGSLRQSTHRNGLIFASAVALLIFAPHLNWMVEHDFSTLRYAGQSQHGTLTLLDRLETIAVFLLIQVRMLLLVGLCAALAALWLVLLRRNRTRSTATDSTHAERHAEMHASPADAALPRNSWLIGLFWVPVALVLGTALLLGMQLQDHWGFQTMQFVALVLAWQWQKLAQLDLRRWLILLLTAHLVSMTVYANAVLKSDGSDHARRTDQYYPARQLAQAVLRDWQTGTPCPLKYIVGPTFESGMVSVYSGVNPQILENNNPTASPWIDLDDLRRAGAVYIEIAAPATATRHGEFALAPAAGVQGRKIRWASVAPESCGRP